MSFGVHLKQLRKSKKVTQEQLAIAIGKHVTQIKRYENDSSEPTASILIKISSALKVSLDELILHDNSLLNGLDKDLKTSFNKVMSLPENKKKSVLDLLQAFIEQNHN